MKRILLFGLISLLINTFGRAQNIDSLVNVLHTQELTSTEQLNIYMQICTFYNNNDNEKLLFYAQEAMTVAEKEEDKSWASRFNMIFGQIYMVEEKYDSAMIYYNKSVAFAEQANNNDLLGGAYSMIGSMYTTQSKLDIALEYYFKALSCLEFTSRRKYGQALEHIGQLYRKLKDLDKAIKYLEQAKDIAEEVNYPNSMMGVYYNLGSTYRMKEEFDAALEYALKSLTLSIENRNKQYEVIAACLVSSIYAQMENNDKALEYALQAVDTAEKFGEKGLIIASMDALSRVYFNKKDYKNCERLAKTAWEIDTLNYSNTGHNLVARLLFTNIQLGQTEDAMYFFKKINIILDQRADERVQKNINELEVKYNTEKKEMQITSLQKEKQLYTWLGTGGILLALALAMVLWQNIRNTKKEKQLIATRSVMDGEMKERTRLARDLHDRLSGNLSAVKIELGNVESLLDISEKLDSCIDEVRRVAHNLMPTSLQHGMKVALEDFSAKFANVHFHFFGEEKRVEDRIEFVIYCCANELVNNSIRHSGAENINLQLIQEDKHVSLTVQDDGHGYDEQAVAKGIGLKNIYDRVTSCNGKIDIISSPDKGTETTIQIKVKK